MIDIRNRTATYIKQNFNITEDTTEAMFDMGLMREDLAKRVLIRDEFSRRARTHKKTELKVHLSEKWAVSLSTVEKILTEGNDCFP